MIQTYRPFPIRAIFLWSLALLGAILLFIGLNVGKNIYTEALWFQSVGYQKVYVKMLATQVALFAAGGGAFLVLFVANAFLALRLARHNEPSMLPPETIVLIRGLTKLAIVFAAVILTLAFGSVAASQWENLLRFQEGLPFMGASGQPLTEPLYNRNPGFYVFTLPLWRFIQMLGVGVVIVLLLEALGIYAAGYSLRGFRLHFDSGVKIHLFVLVAILAATVALGYWFDLQELVFSNRGMNGALFGAGATDIGAVTVSLKIMAALTALLAVVAIVSAFRRGANLALTGFATWTAASILLLSIVPSAYQRFSVQPSELAKEAPYILRNIQMTREAYGLTDIKEAQFPVTDGPPPAEAITNPLLVENIRLWDEGPLLDTLNQIQFFRPYYTFLDVDVDRYEIDGRIRQVMLAAREMTPEQLPADSQSWVARRLQYTHGYGAALGPVNEFTVEGRPTFFLQDLPPAGKLELDRPEVYFGEKTDHYVVVNSKTPEFNYPAQDEAERFTRYQGQGGVALNSLLRKAAFAWRFGDFNLLISDEITPESRLLFYRHIQGRVHRVTPFLQLDADPYAVVADGQLWWVQDAYTATARFPYSQPYQQRLNYIRNSVKVVISAYDGSMKYYVVDPDDAIIRTYSAIFPDLFLPFEQMPAELKKHIRYPAGLFEIQETMFRTYHVADPSIFFSREDTWSRPREIFNDRQQPMDPYYVNMPVPGQVEPEFLLLLPFTPFNRPNLIAWMAARNDPEHYGELVVFTFPRDKQVDGPAQVEARIDNDPTIAQQFTLWGQQGSRIIRGNLLVIPLEGNLLYVEPVYLQAATLAFPELKRVIVAIGAGRPSMEPTLNQAIEVALGQRAPTAPTPDGGPITTPPGPTATPTPVPAGTPGAQPTPDLDQLILQLERLLEQLRQMREGQR